ncbi:MAG: hypothetical protein WDN75_05515 [Bacteroidota bacterium]
MKKSRPIILLELIIGKSRMVKSCNDDQSIPYYLQLKGLNHTGSGDFTQDVFDLKTHTVADTVNTSMGTMQFLNNKRAEVDAVISISEDISKFTSRKTRRGSMTS